MGCRFLCSELVTLILTDSRGITKQTHANLEEIAEWRVVVLCDIPVEPGTSALIRCESHQMRGVVESLASDPSLGYFVGIRLDEDSRWSEERFVPMHLLKIPPVADESGKLD
jgi:hypothetical protein